MLKKKKCNTNTNNSSANNSVSSRRDSNNNNAGDYDNIDVGEDDWWQNYSRERMPLYVLSPKYSRIILFTIYGRFAPSHFANVSKVSSSN